MFPDLNRGRVLLFSSINAKSSSEKPAEHIIRGFLVFSVRSKRPFKASALEKSINASYSTFTSSGLLNIGKELSKGN